MEFYYKFKKITYIMKHYVYSKKTLYGYQGVLENKVDTQKSNQSPLIDILCFSKY